jgi:hypothetical protein
MRFDVNYYYWPGAWVQNRPGDSIFILLPVIRGVNGYDTGRVEPFSHPYPLRIDLTHILSILVKNLSYPTLLTPIKISG